MILLTGKGAETRQKRGIEYIDCPSDVDYAKQSLHEYDVQHGMDGMSKVRALLDVLPLLRRYAGRTIVIKYGGSALDAASTDTILEDAAALQSVGVRVILVHGGGKEISALLEKLNVESQFADGYRVTDEVTLQAAEMALSARVNKSIVAALDRIGAKACGLSGRDGGLITARQKDKALGLVGTITKVDPQVLRTLLDGGYLPVGLPHRPERGGGRPQLQRRRRRPGRGRGGGGGQAGLPHRHRRHPGGQPQPVHPHRQDGREPSQGAHGQRLIAGG